MVMSIKNSKYEKVYKAILVSIINFFIALKLDWREYPPILKPMLKLSILVSLCTKKLELI